MNRFSVFTGIPEMTKGLVRELRVRWAHEELGLPYQEVRYPHPETKKDPYREKQPFGQVPYFESDGLCMFESGAILLHLALKHGRLLPAGESERAQAFSWLFAALNSVEPYMFHYFMLNFQDPDASEGTKSRAKQIASEKLQVVAKALGDDEYFSGEFGIAEIIMTTVLKTALFMGLLGEHPNLASYVARNEARPAFQRALVEHVKLYENK